MRRRASLPHLPPMRHVCRQRSSTTPQESTIGALTQLATVSSVAAVYAVFMSFVYVRLLYAKLGVPPNSVDIPLNLLPIFAFNVVAQKSLAFWAVSLIVVAGFVFSVVRATGSVRSIVLGLGGVGLFPILYHVAAASATHQAGRMRCGHSVMPIVLVLKQDVAARYPAAFLRENEAEGLKLLAATSDSFFVLLQPEPSDGRLPFGWTYQVPRTDVESSRILLPDVSAPHEGH